MSEFGIGTSISFCSDYNIAWTVIWFAEIQGNFSQSVKLAQLKHGG